MTLWTPYGTPGGRSPSVGVEKQVVGEMGPQGGGCVCVKRGEIDPNMSIVIYTYYISFIQVEARFFMTSSYKTCFKISEHPPEIP